MPEPTPNDLLVTPLEKLASELQRVTSHPFHVRAAMLKDTRPQAREIYEARLHEMPSPGLGGEL